MQTGIFLIGIPFFSLLVSTVLFVFGLQIFKANIIIAIVCSAVACYFVGGKEWRKTTLAVVSGLAIFAVCVFINTLFYDWSYDGNTYHKSMIGLLKNGWNPLYMSFFDYADLHFPQIHAVQTWYDAYPKVAEIYAACLYAVTNSIEAGKSQNLLAAVATTLIAYSYLRTLDGFKWWQALVCAGLFAINPISISQMFTYYVDGYLWDLILLCLIACTYITLTKGKESKSLEYYLIFLCINIGFNVKFSAIIFFGMFCLAFYAYWLVLVLRKKDFALDCVKTSFIMFAVSVIFAIVCTGATSYVINTIRYHNPLYTMIGEGSTEIIDSMAPVVYHDMSNIERFLTSLFSRSYTLQNLSELQLKIPFTFTKAELRQVIYVDVRQGGWGVFFSGIFLISLVVIVAAVINWRKKHPVAVHMVLIFLALEVLMIIVVPGMWWARYNMAILYLPVFAMIYLFLEANHQTRSAVRNTCAAGLLAAALFFNCAPNLMTLNMLKNKFINLQQQLVTLKEVTEQHDIRVGVFADFYGLLFTLYDNGVTDGQITEYMYFVADPSEYQYRLFDEYCLYYSPVTESAAEIESANNE